MYLKKLWQPKMVKSRYIALVRITVTHVSTNWPSELATSNETSITGCASNGVPRVARLGTIVSWSSDVDVMGMSVCWSCAPYLFQR